MCVSKHITAGKAKAAGNSLLSPHQLRVTHPEKGATQRFYRGVHPGKAPSLGPDPPPEGRKNAVSAAGNYTRLYPTAVNLSFTAAENRLSPTWKSIP